MFPVNRLRLTFRALDPIAFPVGKPANVLRGALGSMFRTIACETECTDSRQCQRRDTCIYARVFEPRSIGVGPSGLSDWPRPFVFRAAHLDGKTVAADEQFQFDLNLFESRQSLVDTFVEAFAAIARDGFGGGRAELLDSAVHPFALDLTPAANQITTAAVQFLTPTELKDRNALAIRPEFGILFARVRDRISALSQLYGPGPLNIDFKGMGERAETIRMTRCDLRQIEVNRRSGRTGQRHSLGGFVGEAEYEGELAEFVPFLQAAQFTGVGRHTVWGKGQIEVCTGTPG